MGDIAQVTTAAVEKPRTVALPNIRHAVAWSRATDELLAALEREEAAAMSLFEAARERVRAARAATSALRQLRALVTVNADHANGHEGDTAVPAGRRWARAFDACRNCGTTAVKHSGSGRCSTCQSYWQRRGQERPASAISGTAAESAG